MQNIRISPLAILLTLLGSPGCAWISDADRSEALQNSLRVELSVPEPPSANACDDRFELVLSVPDRLDGLTLFATVRVGDADPESFQSPIALVSGERAEARFDVPVAELPVEGGEVPIEIRAWTESGSDRGPEQTLDEQLSVAAAPPINADADGDGFGGPAVPSCGIAVDNSADCDDTDPSVNPDAPELVANNQDDDCDGFDLCYLDADGDGVGSSETVDGAVTPGVDACAGAQQSARNDDCDDTDADRSPENTESALNDFDDDCDGQSLCTVDLDDDGFGDPNTTNLVTGTCSGSGAPDNGLDCDDGNPGINPNIDDVVANDVDEDCDGFDLCYGDVDQDNVASAELISVSANCDDPGVSGTAGLDCDDSDPNINPGAPETVADGVDQDCDGLDDCYVDADADTYGDESGVIQASASCADVGVSASMDDCNDGVAAVNPGEPEVVADGVDQDCDGLDDCYVDGDDDGYGDESGATQASGSCADANVSASMDDCDDGVAAVNPGESEIAGNGVDDDCVGGDACYPDTDGDGYGGGAAVDAPVSTPACADPSQSVTGDDCDDTADTVYPGAEELCDGVDNSCDGNTDDGLAFWLEGSLSGLSDLPGTLSAGDRLHMCGAVAGGSVSGSGSVSLVGHGAQFTSELSLTGGTVSLENLELLGEPGGSALSIDAGASAVLSGVSVSCVSGSQGIVSSGSLISTDLMVSGCTAVEGAGLWSDGAVDLVEAVITGNSASGNGGGVYVASGATGTIVGGVIDENSAGGDGGGVYLDGNGVSLDGVSLTGNVASGNGGGVYVRRTTSTLTNLVVTGNDAVEGGGAYLHVAANGCDLSGGSFDGNSASTGGAVYVSASGNDLSGGSFDGNSASTGGAVYVSASGNDLSGGSFDGNSASTGGGAIAVSVGVSVDIDRGRFTNNDVTGTGADDGGSILRLEESSSATCGTCCEFAGSNPAARVMLENSAGWEGDAPSGLADWTCAPGGANTTCTLTAVCTLP